MISVIKELSVQILIKLQFVLTFIISQILLHKEMYTIQNKRFISGYSICLKRNTYKGINQMWEAKYVYI
jgi:hypothetical protein